MGDILNKYIAEQALRERIDEGNVPALIFYLKSKCGYSDKGDAVSNAATINLIVSKGAKKALDNE